ncbi:MAG: cation:dicarboxylase symporter family transporter, partial [Chloroflexi bacterium]|nr:cation:dicarboxylase symporter family transporter [Chloroflexota bacterium]
YILVGLVGGILGLEFSLLELMLSIPVVFLISFGIPGIPGELLLFAGPLAMILPVPDEMTPLFLALYLGLQIGLPDSFRTGCNTTNNYVYCILLNETYKSRFMAKESKGEMAEPEDWKND